MLNETLQEELKQIAKDISSDSELSDEMALEIARGLLLTENKWKEALKKDKVNEDYFAEALAEYIIE